MKIGLSSIAYTPGGYTTKQFDSILCSKHEIVPILFLHNGRHQELIEECEKLIEKYPQTNYFDYKFNRGCGNSSNEGVHLGYQKYKCDIVIGICQDVCFDTPSAFDDWIEKCTPYIDNKYMICNNDASPPNKPAPYACGIYTPLCIEEVGYFDNNFFPAQYEDMDFHRRCSFAKSGKPEDFWNNSHRIDIASDSTHDAMLSRRDATLAIQQFYITSPLNLKYYIRKWGGEPGRETFTHPFNDENISYKITWHNCNHPYGKYDRHDQGIVRV